MAIYIHCPTCHERLDTMHHECGHCGAELPPGVLYALAASLGQEAPMPQPILRHTYAPAHVTQSPTASPQPLSETVPPAHHSTIRPWLAAALSLFCGLGQLYNGQIVKGMLLIVLGTASCITIQLLIGKLIACIVWPYAIIDAFLVARRSGPTH